MSVRVVTKRRLRAFLVACCALAVVGGIAYRVRDHQLEATAIADRDNGMKQLAAGNWFHAMHNLGVYVNRHPEDADVLFAYAQARQQVSEPENKHLLETLALLRRVHRLSPDNEQASKALLDLCQAVGFDSELLQFSSELLQRDPKSPPALLAQATALYRLRRFDEALKTSLVYNNLRPLDLDAQLLTLNILGSCDHGAEKMVKRSQELKAAFAKDVRFEILQSIAFSLANDPAKARSTISNFTDTSMPDAKTALLMVRQCNALGLYDQALKVLEREIAKTNDAALRCELAGRLWQLDLYQNVLDQFQTLSAGDSTDILAIRCMALYRLGRKDASTALNSLDQLGQTNQTAQCWASVIHAVFAPTSLNNEEAIIQACRAASNQLPHNPFFKCFLADASFRIGESDTAVRAWREASNDAPEWSTPLVKLADVLLGAGQTADACEVANAALQRAPNNAEAMLTDVSAKAANLEVHDDKAADALLVRLDAIAQLHPTEQRVLPLKLVVLIRSGRLAEAKTTILAVIQSTTAKPDASTLLQLAEQSREAKLGLENECLDASERIYGASPGTAFAKARLLYEAGHPEKGLELLDQARKQPQNNKSEPSEWDLAWARYLDLIDDPRCKEVWIALAERYEGNAKIQWAALSATHLQTDHEFIGNVLDRLQSQFGDQGLSWRLARAKWLLDQSAPEKDQVEAATMLGDVTRSAPEMLAPRLMLANCLVRLGNVSGAIDQLSAAANLKPDSSEITLELARLLNSQKDFSRSRIYIERLLKNPTATPQEQHEAAALLSSQGDPQRALDVLEGLIQSADHAGAPDLLLAKLYRQTGQTEQLEIVCKQLLALQSIDVETVSFIADYYASESRDSEASAVLKRLDTLETQPGQKELILGQHALHQADFDKAIRLFQQASKKCPKNPQIWHDLIIAELASNACDDALASAREATSKLPSDKGIMAFIKQAPVAFTIRTRKPDAMRLVSDLLASPDCEPAANNALGILANAGPNQQRSVAEKLHILADNNGQFLTLQLLAASACMDAGQWDDAATISTRAIRQWPNDPTAAGIAARALAACGRWPEALSAARQWRNMSPPDRLIADQLIAAAQVQLGNFDDAKTQLDPYLERAMLDPDRMGSLLLEVAQIKVQAGEVTQAAQMLRPLLSKSNQVRMNWMLIAATDINDPNVASQWLQEVNVLIASDDLPARLALAESWSALAKRSHNAKIYTLASEMVAAMIPQYESRATAEQLVSLGSLSDLQHNPADAERCYRRALRLNPGFVIAQNNLAELLAKSNRLDEALNLAIEAAAADHPNHADFMETLASVQEQRGQYEEAIATLHAALKFAPNHLVCEVTLARVLAAHGHKDLAKTTLQQVEQLKPDRDSIPDDLWNQLQALRSELAQPDALRT
jgi:tetratricopeptide (TPR) repeat protein